MDKQRDGSSERIMTGIETRIEFWENRKESFKKDSAEHNLCCDFLKELEKLRTFVKEGKMIKVK